MSEAAKGSWCYLASRAHLSAGALGLNVARLLALVADLLAGAGVLGAVAYSDVVSFVQDEDTQENLREKWPDSPQL